MNDFEECIKKANLLKVYAISEEAYGVSKKKWTNYDVWPN